MILTIFIFIVILALLVFVHEFGHFIVAKKSGMQVNEFGFGFPPRIFGVQRIGGKFVFVWGHKPPKDPEPTVYSINWIMLGGFVKIVGENNEDLDNPKSFVNKPFFRRLAVLFAGVLMNVILAWVLISLGYISGLPVAVDDVKSIPAHSQIADTQSAIIDVVPDSPAAKAGLAPNDIVVSVDAQTFPSAESMRSYIRQNAGKKFDFEIKRGKAITHIGVQSESSPAPSSGPTGIALVLVGKLKFPIPLAFWEGAKSTISEIGQIASGLYHLVTSGNGLGSLGGPVKIAKLTGEVAGLGFIYLIQFTAFLSINLAILNVLPIPALDGGRIFFLIIEKLRRKPNNQRMEQIANTVGFSLLLLLMLFVTIHDISRLVSG